MRMLVIIEGHGKVRVWQERLKALRTSADVLAIGGHLCRFPEGLTPLGISIDRDVEMDFARRPAPKARANLVAALRSLGPDGVVILALDADVEGDVIALDVYRVLIEETPALEGRVLRARVGAMTVEGIQRAIQTARVIGSDDRSLIDAAVQGRARAISDRWIGGAFSRLAGVRVGRVRSAMLGMVALWSARPEATRGLPETGEVVLAARASDGGRPFLARVAITAALDPGRRAQLIAFATRCSAQRIPGHVVPYRPAGAAIAPRFGALAPFNTGDALLHAARHHGLAPQVAMRGLQAAYMEGLISYPRTVSRAYSPSTALHVLQLGQAAGLPGLSTEHLPPAPADETHEGLHPVSPVSGEEVRRLEEVLRHPFSGVDPGDEGQVKRLMHALVARRAFEAAMDPRLEAGGYDPGTGGLDAEMVALLRDLDWQRETTRNVPWGRHGLTGARPWSLEAILLEGAIREDLGRPSTLAAHVQAAVESLDISLPDPFEMPRLTPAGQTAIRRTPQPLAHPRTCRMIEEALENRGNRLREDPDDSLHDRIRHRVFYWTRNLPKDIQTALVKALLVGDPGQGSPRPAFQLPTQDLVEEPVSALPEPVFT